jgi:hypothetical protein
MNYLKKNLGNSRLPADVMRLIYEYADPLIAIRKQIETHDCDLDEIMYQRMKKYLVEHLILDYYFLQNDSGDVISLNENNIDDRNLKNAILNYHCGYKDLFLWRHKRNQSICGLIHPLQNIMDFEDCLNYVDKKITQNIHNYTHYPPDKIYPPDGDVSKYYIRELYKIWVKL